MGQRGEQADLDAHTRSNSAHYKPTPHPGSSTAFGAMTWTMQFGSVRCGTTLPPLPLGPLPWLPPLCGGSPLPPVIEGVLSS